MVAVVARHLSAWELLRGRLLDAGRRILGYFGERDIRFGD